MKHSLEVKVIQVELGGKYYNTVNEMKIYYNNRLLGEFTDRGEPEDNDFLRDYKWIPEILEKVAEEAYEDGYDRGYTAGYDDVEGDYK